MKSRMKELQTQLKCILMPNMQLTSYKKAAIRAAIKFVIFLVSFIAGLNRPRFGIRWIDFPLTLLVVGLFFYILKYCIYLLPAEFIAVADNKDKIRRKVKAHRSYLKIPVEQIEQMITENDIIEFELLNNNQLIAFGSTAVSDQGESSFHDKRYYIDEQEYCDDMAFRAVLKQYSEEGALKIHSMDGVNIKKQMGLKKGIHCSQSGHTVGAAANEQNR